MKETNRLVEDRRASKAENCWLSLFQSFNLFSTRLKFGIFFRQFQNKWHIYTVQTLKKNRLVRLWNSIDYKRRLSELLIIVRCHKVLARMCEYQSIWFVQASSKMTRSYSLY